MGRCGGVVVVEDQQVTMEDVCKEISKVAMF